MQRRKHQYCPRATHSILAAALGAGLFSAALLGCASEHLLGDMPAPALGNAGEAGYTANGREDFLATELGPPDLELVRTVSESWDATSARSLGDLDADGFEDFAVYTIFDQIGPLSNAHIRYGRPRPRNAAETFDWAESGGRLALNPDPSTNRLISDIQPLGDLDADGYADFFVRTSRCQLQEQLAFVVYGSDQRLSGVSLLDEVAVALKGPVAPGGGCSLGYASDIAAGDFNGDGFADFALTDADVVIDAYAGNGFVAEHYAGGTYLFYGGPERIVSGTSWTQADVKIRAPSSLALIDTGDLDGDGLADLMLSEAVEDGSGDWSRLYWLPGQTQRLPAQVNVEGTPFATGVRQVQAAGDLDGDGRSDLLLYGSDDVPRLFYGHAGMLEAPLDLADADASFVPYPKMGPHFAMTAIPDRDGDGDDELVSSLGLQDVTRAQLLAVLSGTSARASGATPLQEPSNPFGKEPTLVEQVFPVGDVDGDGAGDLMSLSQLFPGLANEDGELQLQPSGDAEAWHPYPVNRLSIHFGTPGGSAAQPVR